MENLEKELRQFIDGVIEEYTPNPEDDWKGSVRDLSDLIHETLPEKLSTFTWLNYPQLLTGASAPRAFGRAMTALGCCEGMV